MDKTARLVNQTYTGLAEEQVSQSVSREAGDRVVVVGHHEEVLACRNNRPLILRRSFNTVDGGYVGVYVVALQRSLDDFEKTRKSMNG